MPAQTSVAYQLFTLGLSVLALAWLAIAALVPLDAETRQVLWYADTGICAFFFADFLYTLATAPRKGRYFVTWGWLDLVSSVPAVSVLRLGRAARIARILRVLRGVRSARALGAYILQRRAESAFLAVLFLTILAIVFSSLAVLYVERAAGGNITTASDALWWALVTISTAGFGDFYPVTTEGRLIGAALLVMGVGLFGTFTAYVAAWFVSADKSEHDEVLAEVRQLRAAVERQMDMEHHGG